MSRPLPQVGDLPGYKLEKFIQGIVAKLIHSYSMSDFVVESVSGRKDSDFRADMIQTGWLAALECQKSHPKESKNPHYLRRAVVNSLLKFEQGDRKRRDTREDIDENAEARPANDFRFYDVELLLEKARLTPAEQLVIELAYGLNDGKEYTTAQIARLMDKSEFYVAGRLRVAKMKLQVVAGK